MDATVDATALDPGAIDAIVGGYHGTPFDILGPHLLDGKLVIRAFLPDAAEVSVVDGTDIPTPMEKIHASGLFEAQFSERKDITSYQLKIVFNDGHILLYEDPYAFPPTLTSFDAHLLAEGTHLHIYERLGAHITELNGVRGVLFAVWAPNASRVSVIGNFNNWDGRRHPMRFHHANGIWSSRARRSG